MSEPKPEPAPVDASEANRPLNRAEIQQMISDQLNTMVQASGNELWKTELTAERVHQIINNRLSTQRPVSWEEDISRNTLDTEPFENLPSPASRDPEDFNRSQKRQVIESMLGGSSLEDMIAKDTFPIPCAEDREGYSPGNDGHYWFSGLEDYLKIIDAAKTHNVPTRSIFDFGCASGRVIRHFVAQSDIETIWGSDINNRHIRWLFEFLPINVRPIFNHCIPCLPMPDGSVDIVSAFSVFTHIDTFETHWLAELSRVLSDDGMAYLTVHNEDTWAVLRDEIDNEKNRLIQSMLRIDPNVRQQLMEPMPDRRLVYRFSQTGPYRAQVFHPNRYLERVWGRFFKIEAILPRHHTRQTVLILRKKR
ncbi:MAG: class I SAM-dependent methyltransferase [Planctomycetota bacterium]